MNTIEQQRRWRLLLGNTANLTPELSATDMGMDAALAALYNQGEGEEGRHGNAVNPKALAVAWVALPLR